jgi:caffeoyl-CoA O-methyltransferase
MLKSLINNSNLNDYVFEMNLSQVSPVMKEMYEVALADSRANYNSPLSQLQLLKLLVLIINPKKILEIGVFRGLSTLAMGEGLSNSDAKIIASDITDEYLVNYKQYWDKAGIAHLIDLRIGDAKLALDKLIDNSESESFDFTYIDANKSSYLDYYEKALILTRVGGVIVIDNILWKGKVADSTLDDNFVNKIRNLNLRIKNDTRVDGVLVAIEDGIWMVRKK